MKGQNCILESNKFYPVIMKTNFEILKLADLVDGNDDDDNGDDDAV